MSSYAPVLVTRRVWLHALSGYTPVSGYTPCLVTRRVLLHAVSGYTPVSGYTRVWAQELPGG